MSTLLFYNFKGGVGKTSLAAILSYQLAEKNKKVLAVDLDAQANLTDILSKTYGEVNPKISLFDSLNNGNLSDSICHLNSNLDILPADWSMSLWNQSVEHLDKKKRNFILSVLLTPLKDKYDFIILDVPPTLSTLVNNAVLAADAISIVLQTQQSAFTGALKTASYLQQLREDYNADFKMLGIILYLMKKTGAIDNNIAKLAKEEFKNGVYANEISTRERVKRWSNNGITNNKKDIHDQATQRMYELVLNETLYRMQKLGVDK
ncbi:ParA family protein [Lactobacillus sp. ESL0679]|uniref:ParA family protein n=1 Tax=Lactobacillus sp. ESL0679 TaxID=2983209 RepID=UPI0023F870E1|nr:ParA family protein [Lactobacillus sp. ESL0679]MDF7683781.1 ParA family protein [Lactobacillus sp. ESL0679]